MRAILNPETFAAFPIVGILRGFPLELTREIARESANAGLLALEVTMNTPGAAEQIAALVQDMGDRLCVGAGTVTSVEEFLAARDAGAGFIVTPNLELEVLRLCREAGIPAFPGAMTPTEIVTAWTHGATMVKLFPAGALGPGYLKAVKAPLDRIPLLPTGGVSLENAAAFLAAGASGFGIGSPLFARARMEARDWAWLRERIAAFQELF
ncbi:MAG: bifunctional 4-hydroxy-2-oxoglutarate aldolase/2-dehydro-3-deoxy-phosphogluconate aldolase [Victivallales bacterium]|jgi:2-dehydro-3-deoxyphosphogluconate aldolase / (4S)-4-hydroxy-2-oxoglutarate aldolase|nr:bifunctional 4-hydroxy-2-oxoglutarate aldolase/2-dehydro-3-deoxy-phosphogluconate aldolase [Victivallales bacterium]MBT7165351.1 bifunctional 4-hydroxy-2-oxoglutarate aldolase/2-dehydro-3-deoxy-phosphogluconate aldolase [Victivallales bacterium]MBT7300187.1 bifunctional 4-hydroxy-2-oxoglutarate aldolase/2-dehydro-3-deoxy-phosphogluconate aldolase [Victivallales bacterium]